MNVFCELPKDKHYPSDPIAEELMAALLTTYEDRNHNPTDPEKWEIEGRLGTILDKTNNMLRIRLPVETEALMAANFQHSFDPGVTKTQFFSIHNALCHSAGLLTAVPFQINSNPPLPLPQTFNNLHPYPEWSYPITSNNETVFFKLDDSNLIRCSYPINSDYLSTSPIETIVKDKLMRYEIYMGKDMNQGEEEEHRKRLIDLRISINVESTPTLPNNFFRNPPIFRRLRHRQTFVHITRMIRVDCTIVDDTLGGRGRNQFEIEVEMNPTALISHLQNYKKRGDSVPLFSLCSLFLNVLRDLVGLVNRGSGGSILGTTPTKTKSMNKTPTSRLNITPEQEQNYNKFITNKLPLIGDYLFRAVIPNLKGNNESGIIKETETSIYTNNPNQFDGPYFLDPQTRTVLKRNT